MVETYPQRLANLNLASFLLPSVAQRLCLLTGQSDFATSDLPADKTAFLKIVAPTDTMVTHAGFPWHADFTKPAHATPTLLAASYRNARQWIWARRDERYRNALSNIINTVAQRTEKRLLFVLGSCGVDLLAEALSRLPARGPEIWAAILGPAGRIPLHQSLTRQIVIQGRYDIWSRALWRGSVQNRPKCGHLDYYTDTETLAVTTAFFAGKEL
jgi:hypothetical protein